MKAILMSIRPEWVAKILNGEKTIEIRKKFPKDYVGWVYIYVTKDRRYFLDQCAEPNDNSWFCWDYDDGIPFVGTKKNGKSGKLARDEVDSFNGTVIARFWCDKVEEIKCIHNSFAIERYITDTLNIGELMVESCVSFQQMQKYLYYSNGYAIHITDPKPFDKPKDISEFSSKIEKTCICFNQFIAEGTRKIPLTKAPQSWCYVEV